MAVEIKRHRFTVADYERMVEAGILGPDDRVELFDGEIVEMSPIGSRHSGSVSALARLIITVLADRAHVGVQMPIVTDDFSEPEPDLYVARLRDDGYFDAHPRIPELLWVIEVAESSLRWDRTRKIPAYGRAGIPESWLVDLEGGRVEVYRGPGPDGYAERMDLGPGEVASPEAFGDVTIPVDEILGRRPGVG